jgi:hypothetical protein
MAWYLVKQRDNFTFTFLPFITLGVKQPAGEKSPSYSAEIMNAWSYISSSPHVFMA